MTSVRTMTATVKTLTLDDHRLTVTEARQLDTIDLADMTVMHGRIRDQLPTIYSETRVAVIGEDDRGRLCVAEFDSTRPPTGDETVTMGVDNTNARFIVCVNDPGNVSPFEGAGVTCPWGTRKKIHFMPGVASYCQPPESEGTCECTSPWRVNNQYRTEVAHRDVMAAEVRITERAEKARAALAADLLILAGSDR